MRFWVNGQQIQAECGQKLSAYLHVDAPCGGKGKCGKCKVLARGGLSPMTEREKALLTPQEIEQGIRLACMAEIAGEGEICTIEGAEHRIAMDGVKAEISLHTHIKEYGMVVDIGTTTVVIGVYDAQGALLGKKGFLNPQTAWGADVISRIEKALAGEAKALQTAIVTAIEQGAIGICEQAGIDPTQIDTAVITGNTAMLYLLTNTAVDGLARMPFSLERPFNERVSAQDLGMLSLSPNLQIYLPPCISPFLGADMVCALLVTRFWEQQKTFLLADVGTNGEMALFHYGKGYACSTAAGPAFEGAGLTCGMRGEAGAIEHVRVEDGVFKTTVIGNQTAKGICGSGVVDSVACLLELGVLDESGYMDEDAELAQGVRFTRKDVRAVQLANGAIFGGITTLLKTVGVQENAVETFMLAGGFGGYLHLENAGKIRLFPEKWVPCTKVMGNAAYNGAVALLLDERMRTRCVEAAGNIEVVDLSKSELFVEAYADGMLFE